MQEKKKIAIGLGTYKRPQMLEKCLISLQKQITDPHFELALILVDNDADGTANEVFERCKPQFPYEVHYFVHSEKGIAAMRNRVIEESLRIKADFLAFIDDDETAEPDWILNHWNGIVKYNADVTAGYVEQLLPDDTPQHMRRFYHLTKHKSGTLRTSGSTRNILFNLGICRDKGLRFNPALNLTGSSDTFFFEEAYAMGAKIVWVQEAKVYEEMPKSRITKTWLWNRAFRHGNSLVVRTQIREGRLKAFRLLPSAIFKLLLGIIEWLLFSFAGKTHRIGKVRRIKNAFGMLSALFGKKYYEYNATHGN